MRGDDVSNLQDRLIQMGFNCVSESDIDQLRDRVERLKAQVRAKGEHAFRVVKRQFGFTKVRYRGLTKNTAQLRTLFALANLWMARRALMNTG